MLALSVSFSSSAAAASSASSPSVFSGLVLRSSHDDLRRLEQALDGRWGSFNLFEQWLNDSMKWQWRDAMMEREYKKTHWDLEVWRREAEKRILDTVDLRLQQLWLGRMQALEKASSEKLEREFIDLLIQKVPGVEHVLHSIRMHTEHRGPKEICEHTRPHRSQGCRVGASTTARGDEDGESKHGWSRNQVEIESALMASEDMRSRLIDITTSDIYRPMMYARDLLLRRFAASENPREVFGVLEDEAARQLREIKHLRQQYESEQDVSFEPETVKQEHLQIEAASSMLQAELADLQQRRTVRQQQLLDLRTTARHKLEKVTALFDEEQKSMKAVEQDWDEAQRVLERIEKLMESNIGGGEKLQRIMDDIKQIRLENSDLKERLQAALEEQQAGGGEGSRRVKGDAGDSKKEEAKKRKLKQQEEKAEMRRKKEEELRRKRELKEAEKLQRAVEEAQKKKAAKLFKTKSTSSLLSGWGGSSRCSSRRSCRSADLSEVEDLRDTARGSDAGKEEKERDGPHGRGDVEGEGGQGGGAGGGGGAGDGEELEDSDVKKDAAEASSRGRNRIPATRDKEDLALTSAQHKKRLGSRFSSLFSWGRSTRRSSSTPATLKQVRGAGKRLLPRERLGEGRSLFCSVA